jgi:UDP-N-acetylmuramate--alanine ligase
MRVAEVLDLSRPRRIHIVGIGGAGMSAIASVLAAMGHTVSGSDLKDSGSLGRLRASGIDVHVGHAAELVDGAELVAVSTAIPPRNPEVVAANERGLTVARRAEILGAIASTRRCIAVSGTHGKTTTSSMLALVLVEAGLNPSFIIGGELNEIGSGAVWDDGDWFVVEADESDGTFLELAPEAALVSNVEPDHLDHYGGFEALVTAFEQFVDGVPGVRVLCADDEVARRLAVGRECTTYGWHADATYRVVDYAGGRRGSTFALHRGTGVIGVVELPVPGRHNALNAAGAAAVALELGVPFDAIARALRGFGGVARRFQFRGEVGGVTLVDDYAHLPTEVTAALRAAREGEWRRVVAVFQPHRYTRTARLWRDFADAFVDADVIVLTDVYPAGEAPQPGVSGRLVLRAVLDAHPSAAVTYLPRHADVVAHTLRLARDGDIVLTLGAGDLTTAPDAWLARAAGSASP